MLSYLITFVSNRDLKMKKVSFNQLINTDQLVLVDFFAEWCAPCKALKPILKEVKQMVGSKVKIIKIDIDKNPRVAQIYNVRSVPTLILFKSGSIIWKQSGVLPAQHINQVLLSHL